jgi:hypothetical protein
VSRNRFEDQFPLIAWVQFEDLEESFVRIRRGSDERCLFLENTGTGDPIEGISPAILFKSMTARFFEFSQKMDRIFQL